MKVRTPPWAEMPGCFQHEVVPHDFPWSPRSFLPPWIFAFVVAFLHLEAKNPDFSWSPRAGSPLQSCACGDVFPDAALHRLVVPNLGFPWHLSLVPIWMASEVLSSVIFRGVARIVLVLVLGRFASSYSNSSGPWQ